MRVNRDSQYYLVDTSVSFNTQNVWNNLIWTLDPTGTGTWSVYVNGVQSTSAASTLYPNPIKRSMNYLGRSNWAADPYLNGGIKDFRMYSKVLSAAEVHTLFTSTQTIFLVQPNARAVQRVGFLQQVVLYRATYAPMERLHSLVCLLVLLVRVVGYCTRD